MSQIDGDFFTGFDKRGITAGIKAYAYLSESTSFVVDILYTQKGSFIPHGTVVYPNSKNDLKIFLHYVELPFLLKFTPQPKKRNFYLECGPVLSRLVDSKIVENHGNDFLGTFYTEIQKDFRPLSNFSYWNWFRFT